MKTLTLATRNPGKIREMKELLRDLPVEVKSTADFPSIATIEETGTTFEENALLKAQVVHRVAAGFVLADDSGLECDDLQGAPGVNSAYFAGGEATDQENNQKLINELMAVHDPSRAARYVCVLALVNPARHENTIRPNQ